MNEEFDFSNFDANSVDTSYTGESQPVPAGVYEAMITSSEMKRNKSGTGSYLSIGLTIVSGEHAKRMVFDNLNIVHQSEQAREIGLRTLAKIYKACGKTRVRSHEELRNIPMLVKVAVRPPEGQFAARNEVKDYAPDPNYVQTPAPAAPVAPAPVPQPQFTAVQTPAVAATPVPPAPPANPAGQYPSGRAPWVR